MKKTLIALGVLAALPSLALSAEVSIYGKVDVGLAFVNVDPGVDGQDSWSNLSMQSGQTAGSRVGMTGFEELGNGHKVGFILENGFNVDNGAMGQGGKIFGRQALLYLDGPYGNIKFGKMGALTSGYPSTGLFGGNMSPFAVGLGEVAGHRYLYSSEDLLPLDNTITYASPSWAGWQFLLQYSMGMNMAQASDTVENESSVDRYMAAAIRFDNKNTEFNFVVDSTNYRSYGDWGDATPYDNPDDDGLRFTVGVRHGLGFMTLYAGGQYFKNSRSFAQEANQFYRAIGSHNNPYDKGTAAGKTTPFLSNHYAKDGWALNLGLDYPALGGTWKAQAGYMDAEFSEDSSLKMKRWFISAGYWYDFSKRTTLYSGISFIQDKLEGNGGSNLNYDQFDDANAITASLGIVHNF